MRGARPNQVRAQGCQLLKPQPRPAGPNLLNPATLNAKAPAVYLVKLNTTKGPIVIRVTKNWAPIGADRFYNLVRAGFYNNNIIFRSTKQFAQFGIPPRPELSRVWMEQTMLDDRVIQSNKRAHGHLRIHRRQEQPQRAGLHQQGGQRLPGQPADFAPFGEVIEGLDVLDMLYTGYGEQVTNLQSEIRTRATPSWKRTSHGSTRSTQP